MGVKSFSSSMLIDRCRVTTEHFAIRRQIMRCVLLYSASLIASFQFADQVLSDESVKTEILVVNRSTDLFQREDERLVVLEHLPDRSVLQATTGISGGPSLAASEFKFVTVLRNNRPISGWIRCRDAVSLSPFLMNRTQEAFDSELHASENDLPALVTLESKKRPGLKESWLLIQQSYVENAQRKEPLPEPYFSRGEFWAAIRHNEAAVHDFRLAANRVVQRKDRDELIQYARYFRRLHDALMELDLQPRPTYAGDSYVYYQSGYRAYFGGESLNAALRDFDNALQLNSREPIFYYFRALTNRRLGREREALRDAQIGASYEGEELRNYGRSDVNGALFRVQGRDRLWLEEIRKGSPPIYDPHNDSRLPSHLKPDAQLPIRKPTT